MLDVSRTAIWKVMNQLKDEGYVIDAVKNKGYKLIQTPDIVTAEEVDSLLETEWAGHPVVYEEEQESTNQTAKMLAEQGASHGTLVVAERQVSGRGRRGRTWHSPKGSGIWMSILLRPQSHPMSASMLTLVAAMAVAKGITRCTGMEAKIKWPNDIVINGKKVVGILTEMSAQMDYVNHIVVGVGINVNNESFPEEIAQNATSLLLQSGKRVNRAALIEAVWEEFEHYYDRFMAYQDLRDLRKEYDASLANKGQKVRVLDTKEPFEGVAQGITDRGELIVDTWEARKLVSSGEVSVRGIYGYV